MNRNLVPDTSKCPFQYFLLQNLFHTAKYIIMKAMTMKAKEEAKEESQHYQKAMFREKQHKGQVHCIC